MTAGTVVYVMAWTSFLQPNHLASGGLTGLTTILDYATQGRLPMDFTFALINVFLLVATFLLTFTLNANAEVNAEKAESFIKTTTL